MTEYKRGNDTSDALVEVRTVLNRAATSLATLEREKVRDGEPLPEWLTKNHPEMDPYYHADPDIDDMIDALSETIRRLDKYRRTGKTKR